MEEDHWKPATKMTNHTAVDLEAFSKQFGEVRHQIKFKVMAKIRKKQHVREDDVIMDLYTTNPYD